MYSETQSRGRLQLHPKTLRSLPKSSPSPMASSTSRVFSRLSSMALKLNNKKASMPASIFGDSFFKSTLQSSSKRLCLLSRLPVELSGVQTMLPLHSAIASARLRSSLSIESQTWGLVPQGISLPL